MTYREEIIRECADHLLSYDKNAGWFVLELLASGKKCKYEQLKQEIEKEKIQAQKEVVFGYYNRISFQKPTIDGVFEWLQSDKDFLDCESIVQSAKDVIMNYDPHEVSKVQCSICNNTWIAVRPKGIEKLECPNCNNLAEFQNIEA